ncbi:BURP domain-containing protein 6-like [Bidens hawaiensis]|uniref:BURP domain-containing protein 6-like n=1 Tax=Bidens hawaiensis TaxID=980011 RepID=UPI00404967B2
MNFKLLHVFALLLVALVGSHAVSPEVYWKAVLPNSPMPKAIKDILYIESWDDGNEKLSTKDASFYIEQPEQTYSYVASQDELKDHQGQFHRYAASKGDASMFIDQPEQTYSYVASQDELKGHHGQFSDYATSKNQVKDHPAKVSYVSSMNHHPKENLIATLLFLEKDLQQGEEMKLHFLKNYENIAFLPRQISDSIPFSSKDLPEIYSRFSVLPDSVDAKIMKHTLNLCEYKAIKGEERTCVTSLESMVDFSTSQLGKRVKALSTEVNAKDTPSQMYKIESVRMLAPSEAVICHKQNYVYAVFYCHITGGTRSHAVSLEGADGTKVKSVAICHNDTSNWNPKYLAFEVLKVKPGSVPICHFLPEEHILWVPY